MGPAILEVMLALLLVGFWGCSEDDAKTVQTDTQSGQEEPICTQDEFCDAFMTCFGFVGEDRCHDYYDDGMGVCSDADEETLEDFHLCMCECWISEEDRSCLGMGSCSDWCTSTVCSVL